MSLRIAFLIDVFSKNFTGGGQIHLTNLLRKLKKNHHTTGVIFSQPNPSFLSRFFWSLWIIPVVFFYHYKRPFSLLHSHGYQSGLTAKIISLFLRIPVVHTVHGTYYLDVPNSSMMKHLEKFFLLQLRYDAQITVARNFFVHKNQTKKVEYIPNGVDTLLFKRYIRERKRGKAVKIIFVGRLEKVKGVHILIQALKNISQKKIFAFSLTVIGDGSFKNNLIEQVKSVKLKGKIIFLGRKSPFIVAKYLKSHDIFVFPSIGGEGQALTLLEAWACKLPVVVTRVGDNPYLVRDSYNGFITSPDNVKALEKSIVQAVKNRNKWRQIGIRGYNFVTKTATWDNVAQRTYNIYKDLVAN